MYNLLYVHLIPPMATIKFYCADIHTTPITNKKFLKSFISYLFKKEKKSLASLSYVFASDNYLLEINQKHLKHNFFTDIITFDLSNNTKEIIGEAYISVERVRENAIKQKTTLKKELLRVIFHGALHLCDYTDKKKSEITIMRQKEEEYLCLFEEQLKNSST